MKTNNCTRMESLLPLHAGGDLSGKEAVQVETHLVGCAVCRTELAELSDGRAWLSGLAARAPELNDAQLAAVRDTVLRTIQRDQQRPVWTWLGMLRPARLALASLILLFAFGALAMWLRPADSPDELIGLPLTLEQKIVPELGISPPPLVSVHDRFLTGRRRLRSPRHISPRAPEQQADFARTPAALPDNVSLASLGDEASFADAAPAPEALRIEIQTADPNIRIIWLASSADASSLHPPTTK